MQLDFQQRQSISQVLEILRRFDVSQAFIAQQAGVPAVDLSRLKLSGSMRESRWERVLQTLRQLIAEGFHGQAESEVKGELERLLALAAGSSNAFADFLSSIDLVDEELRRAVEAARYALDVNDDFPSALPPSPLTLVHHRYSSFDSGLSTLNDQLLALLAAALEETDNRVHPAFMSDTASYDLVIRWGRAYTTPVVCLFPFFLTAPRRTAWGVIPYGMQREIGVIVPKPSLRLLQESDSALPLGPHDLLEMLRHIRQPSVTFRTGFAAEEILYQMALKHGTPRHVESLVYAERREVSDDADIRGCLEDSPSAFAFFDLTSKGHVEESLVDARFAVRRLKHETTVPVGIGFSLPALLWVGRTGIFSRLRQAAIECLKPMKRELAEIGIELCDTPPPNDSRQGRPR